MKLVERMTITTAAGHWVRLRYGIWSQSIGAHV